MIARIVDRLRQAIRTSTPSTNTVSENDVRAAFRLLLGRGPGGADIARFTRLGSLDAVRQGILASPEFVRRFVGQDVHVNPYVNFHHIHTVRMTARRQEHLAGLGLPLRDRSVLESGAGICLHSSFFLDRGCTVLATDGRAENVEIMKALYDVYSWYLRRGALQIGLLDIEADSFVPPNRFEIVYCYGLLYHCARPSIALRNMRACCSGLLLIETSVQTGDIHDLHVGAEDPHDVSQSIHGGGSHPTREWILGELRKYFPHVGVPRTQPNHEYFPIDWRNPERFRDQTMRCVFVASDAPLAHETFVEEIPEHQTRAD